MNLAAEFLRQKYREWEIPAPHLQVVLGSGLSTAFAELKLPTVWRERARLNFGEVEGLSSATAPGHAGEFRFFLHQKTRKVLGFQVGRLHGFEGLEAQEVVSPVLAAFHAGTKSFVLTNAAGALKKRFKVGSVMLIEDHVNLTGRNPLVGPNAVDANGQPYGPRFPDMSETYEREFAARIRKALKAKGLTVNDGIYLGVLGPSFETPAEIALFAKWGLGAVGMSTVWEAIALRHAGARIGGVSYISNLGCGLSSVPLRHDDVEIIGKKISKTLVEALFALSEAEFQNGM